MPTAMRGQGDIQGTSRHPEAKGHRMFAGRQANAAHDEIAAQQLRRFSVHGYAPMRVVSIIQQQNGRRVGLGLQNNIIRSVTLVINGPSIGIGSDSRPVFWRRGHQHCLRRIKIRVCQRFQDSLIIGVDLPVCIHLGPGQGAGEFKQGQITIRTRCGSQIFQSSRLRNWLSLGTMSKALRDPEAFLPGIQFCVEHIQKSRRPEQIPCVRKFPKPAVAGHIGHRMGR